MTVRPLLLCLSVFLISCTASVAPHMPPPLPVPTTPPSEPREVARAEPQPAPDSSAAAVYDQPVTVLPSIIGRSRRGRDNDVAVQGGPAFARDGDQSVRIALLLSQRSARLSASGDWNLYDRTSEHLIARVRSGDYVTVELRGETLSASGASGVNVGAARGPFLARAGSPDALIAVNGHRYRGDIVLAVGVDGMNVINRVSVEDYLRGVVPLEIGTDRTPFENAAVQAQAIAARSYAYSRLDDSRTYDMLATVTDQVYGGADAERPLSDAAIAATRSMVLMYQGKVINAPYHSNAGGATAAASEVWRSNDEPYLVSVTERIPGTDHFYGEDSPKFRWNRTLDRGTLSSALSKYLPQYAGAPRSGIGSVRRITETGRTPSGRVAGLIFETDRGRFTVRGNDVRFVLRQPGGDILPSTLFTFDVSTDDDGSIDRLTLSGTGNGHGVGMDQWGAIARARAGQDVSTILRAYYPGTTIARVI